jgi:lysophospholipase L1-like esterase
MGAEHVPGTWQRYVAIGDSSTEGLDDPDGAGGYRGWADRLAGHLAAAQGSVEYANLAVRGRTTVRILEEQLAPALRLRPDLMTVATGVNDLLRPAFDADEVAGNLEQMLVASTAQGVTTVTVTWPDPARLHPVARLITGRVGRLNDAIRAAASRTGALVLDLARHPVAGDPRLWSEDRLHANARGHERIAAALAHLLELPGHDEGWVSPLVPPMPPTAPAARRLRQDAIWLRRHAAPWALRRLRRRASGDEVGPKRPEPRPVAAADDDGPQDTGGGPQPH